MPLNVAHKTKQERNTALRRDAERIVAGIENYSGADRLRRSAEVRAAFPPAKGPAKATAKTSAKPTTKKSVKTSAKPVAKKSVKPAGRKTTMSVGRTPARAGLSTGSHSGDAC
jgi:hypothetical protein